MSQESAASRVQANIKELFKGKLAPGEAHIKFQLTAEITALLSMQQVQESLVVDSAQITALPGMPATLIGIMNSRDRVFCVFDLAHCLGLTSTLISCQQYQIVVLEVSQLLFMESKLYIGFAVEQIGGITRMAANDLQPARNLPITLSPYVLGTNGESKSQLILNLPKIIKTISTIKGKSQSIS